MAKDKASAIAEAGNAPNNLLYLVLHGLISLVDVGDDGFIAYALEIGTAHRYLYGNWLTEQEIPVRPQGGQPLIAELTGVDSGEETLNTNFNVVVQVDKAPDVDHDDVRAVFKLPRPSKIHHFVAGTLANALQGTLKPIAGKPVALSGIRIFEYTFQDSGDVHLTQASGTEPLWMCPGAVRAKGQTLKVAVLHIYDQPGEDMLDHTQHTLDEFKKSAAFLGTDITLSNAVIAGPQTSSLPGLLPAETTCLSRRQDEVLTILDALRSGILSRGTGGCPGGGVCAGCDAVLVR